MARFRLWFIIGGIALGVWGVKEVLLSRKAKAEPQSITCEALGRDGPGDNAYVKLESFIFSSGTFVYEEKRSGSTWNKVWVPTLPLGGDWHQKVLALLEGAEEGSFSEADLPAPTAFHVIVRSEHVKNAADLDRLGDLESLTGLVVNEIESLGKEEKKILRESYPTVDLDRCIIIDHARKPKSMVLMIGLVLVALALLGMGVKGYIHGRRKPPAPETGVVSPQSKIPKPPIPG